MVRVVLLGRAFAQLALGVDEFHGILHIPARVTLVAVGLLGAALGARALDLPVGQEPVARFTLELAHRCLRGVTILLQGIEYLVRDFSLLGGGCAAELAEVDVEEFVYLLVLDPLLLADLLVGQPFLHGFELGGRALFIGAADVDRVVAHESALAVVHVCREHTPDDIAQMRHVIYLRQC